MFAVIIPFFQREQGVLARALRSVARQDVADQVVVYVVDDGSPVPPEPEVESVPWRRNFKLRILKKTNGGPGSARNYALDRLDKEEYVAFLDSDDSWHDHHLSAAKFAFSQNFDLYTADWALDQKGTRALNTYYGDSLPLIGHGQVDWAHELRDDLIKYTVKGPIGKTSSMVLTRHLLGSLRFDSTLRTAGEDGLFATSLASKKPRVMISTRIDTVHGKGVNIFSADDWDSRKGVMRCIYFLRSRILMRPLVRKCPAAERTLNEKIDDARRSFWQASFSAARHGDLPLMEAVRLVLFDPPLIGAAATVIYGAFRKKAAGSR